VHRGSVEETSGCGKLLELPRAANAHWMRL
jgi:hypothetical protein